MLPRQRRRQHDLAALSPACLGIYITSRPSRLDNTIASMTRQHCPKLDSTSTSHRTQVATATLSSAGLGSAIISMIYNTIISMTQYLHHITVKSPRQLHRQQDSVASSPA
jgi:hypothetical protein